MARAHMNMEDIDPHNPSKGAHFQIIFKDHLGNDGEVLDSWAHKMAKVVDEILGQLMVMDGDPMVIIREQGARKILQLARENKETQGVDSQEGTA